MEIRWFGQSFFEVKTDTNIKKEVKIYFDPFNGSIGLKEPSGLEADVVLVSHDHEDHNNVGVFEKKGVVFRTAGEYSASGVDIKGMVSFHDKSEGAERGVNIIFSVFSEGMKIVHLGDLGHPLSEKQIKDLGTVDVLFVPIGNVNSLDLKDALKTIKDLAPKIIVPMHYKIEGLNRDLSGLEPFCKEMGVSESEPQRKLVLKQSGIEGKDMEITILEKN